MLHLTSDIEERLNNRAMNVSIVAKCNTLLLDKANKLDVLDFGPL